VWPAPKEGNCDQTELDRHEPSDDTEGLHEPAREKSPRRPYPALLDPSEIDGRDAMTQERERNEDGARHEQECTSLPDSA
jgi:hypothetical protein